MENIIEKIKKITGAYQGEDDPEKRLDWLKELIDAYQRYLPPRVSEKIKIDPRAKKVEGERKDITVLFADLTGFTALSETMDAEDIARIINDFFTRMVKIVHKYGGSVDKFLGDALMVLFGAPVAHYDDPERAVRTALEMQQEMEKFNVEKGFALPLSMSIGINTGPVVALNVGSDERMEYTVIGDTVNLAARLEAVAGPKEILVSQFTYERIADIVEIEKRPSVKVKGKRKPVVNYLVKGIQEHYRLPEPTKVKFIGRDEEIKRIIDAFIRVKGNIPLVIGITGEPGSGKTRLGLEVESLAREERFTTIGVRCLPYEINIPYITFIGLFDHYLGLKSDTPEEQRRLVLSLKLKSLGLSLDNLLPYIGTLYGMNFPEVQSLPPDELKKRMFNTIKEMIDAESKKAPLLLRIEDLQWADPTSVEVLDYLIKELRQVSILFLLEYRSDYAFPYLNLENCEHIFLKNFTKEESKKLIKAILEEEGIEPGISDLIFEKSAGNPLFITEIVKLLLKKNGIRKTKDGYVPTERFKKLEIAGSISSVILDQIDRLNEFDKRILQYASVVGRSFEPGLLSRILDVPRSNLKEDLQRLEHFEGILISNPEKDSYEFISPTTYEVVYNSLLKTKRRELHTIIGEELERIPEERHYENLEKLAFHFARSNDDRKGIYYLKSAADKSYRFYALNETLSFFNQALELLYKKELSDEEIQDKLEVLRRMGWVLRLLGRLEQAIKNQKRSLKLAKRVNSLKDEAGANLNIGIIYQEMGIPKKGLNYWTRARRIAKKIGDKNIQGLAENNLGNYYLHISDLDKALECFQSVADLSKEIDDKKGLALANLNLGLVMERKGEFQKAIEHYNSAYRIFEEITDKENMAKILLNIGVVMMQRGEVPNAIERFNDAIRLSSEIGDKMNEMLGLGNLGEVYGRMWQLDKAYDYFSQSLTIAQIIGEPHQTMGMNLNIGDIHLYRGSLNQAQEYHKKAIAISEEINDPFNEGIARRSLGWDYYYSGDYRLAIDEFQRSEEIFMRIGDRRNGVISSLARSAVLVKFENIEEIEPMIKGIEAKAREINDLEILALALEIEADCLMIKRDIEGSSKVLRELKDLSKEIGNKRLYAWTLSKSGDLQMGLNLTREIGDKILETKILISQAKNFMKESDWTNALITLNKATEQARQAGTKELTAEALFLTSQIFEKIGKKEEGKRHKDEYNRMTEEITKGFSDAEKMRYAERLSEKKDIG